MSGDQAALLACPFCGGDAVLSDICDQKHPDNGDHFVQCTNGVCAVSSKLVFAYGDDPTPTLISAWNARAPTAKASEGGVEAKHSVKDYAIEFAEYLAKSAERYIAAVNSFEAVRGDDCDQSVEDAEAEMTESYSRLQSDIYEFRKRRDRVTPTPPQTPNLSSASATPKTPA